MGFFGVQERNALRQLLALAPQVGQGSPVLRGILAPAGVLYRDTQDNAVWVSVGNRAWLQLGTAEQVEDIIKSLPDDGEKEVVEADVPAAWESHDDGAYTDVVVPIGALDIGPSSSQPTSAVFGGNYPSLASRRFAQGDYAYIDGVQIPHGYVEYTNIHPHFHFYPVTDIADGETVLLSLTLAHSRVWEVLGDEQKFTLSFKNDADQRRKMFPSAINSDNSIRAFTHCIAGKCTLDGSTMEASSVIMGQISYLSASTYSGNIFAASYDSHAKFDRFGTRLEYSD